MEELRRINCMQRDENRQLRAENKLLWRLVMLCWVCWVASEVATIYLAGKM